MTSIPTDEFMRGMSFGFMARNGVYARSETLAEVDRMADLGITWVAVMATVMQDTFASQRIYRDCEFTPDDEELGRFIDRCRARGLRVMLKPILECHDSVWRGMVNFPSGFQQIQGVVADYWGPWFASYARMLAHYARLAARHGVEMLCIGCEMHGAEPQTARWRELVAGVRALYPGLLTYNANYAESIRRPEIAAWLRELDLVGTSFYKGCPQGSTDPSVVAAALAPWADQLAAAVEELGRPVYFAECGARSVKGGTITPSEHRRDDDYDGAAQSAYLEAVLATFWDRPWFRGLYWWKWDERQERPQYRKPGGDTGFTLAGKPAAEALARWYGRPDRR